MGDLLPGTRTLIDVTLPGTHDSGAYHFINDEVDKHNKRWKPWIEGLGAGSYASLIAQIGHSKLVGTIAGWGKAQSMRLVNQLERGIRYVDLRVMRSQKTGKLHFCHGLVGEEAAVGLEEIAGFLRHTRREVVIADLVLLDFQPRDYDEMAGIIDRTVAPLLAPVDQVLSKTLDEITTGGSRLFLMCNDDELKNHGGDQRIGRSRANAGYPETNSPDTLEKNASDHLSRAAAARDGLSGMQWILTPTQDDIVAGVKNMINPISATQNLRWLNGKCAGRLRSFLNARYAVRCNLIVTDFFEDSDAVDIAIARNFGEFWTDGVTRNKEGGWTGRIEAPAGRLPSGIEVKQQARYGITNARLLFNDGNGAVSESGWTCGNQESQDNRSRCFPGEAITKVQIKEQGGYGIVDLRFWTASGKESGWLAGNPDGGEHAVVTLDGLALTGLQGREQGRYGLVDMRFGFTNTKAHG